MPGVTLWVSSFLKQCPSVSVCGEKAELCEGLETEKKKILLDMMHHKGRGNWLATSEYLGST